jgi:hypothetical protein
MSSYEMRHEALVILTGLVDKARREQAEALRQKQAARFASFKDVTPAKAAPFCLGPAYCRRIGFWDVCLGCRTMTHRGV